MEKEIALACIVGPVYLVYGLSVLIYARQWKKAVAWLEKDHFAFLPIALPSLVFGLILVNAYNIWDWTPFVLITLTGWILVIKPTFYFLAPGSWTTAIFHWKFLWHNAYYRFAGAVMAAVGALLMWYGYCGR